MSAIDYVILAVVTACFVLAVYRAVRGKKSGCAGCSGCCAECRRKR